MKSFRVMTLLVAGLIYLSTGCQPVRKEIFRPDFGRIDNIVEEEIDKGSFPGAVVLVGKQDDILYWKAFGNEVVEP